MRSRLLFRVRQFTRALGARPTDAVLSEARRLLSDRQWTLFNGMSPRDRWHSIETLRLLRQAGWHDPDLEVAALLHDAGKGFLQVHERVLYVLLTPFPRLLCRLAAPDGKGLRSAMYRSLHHAEKTAELAIAADTGPRAVRLIREHHRGDLIDAAAMALADADDRA